MKNSRSPSLERGYAPRIRHINNREANTTFQFNFQACNNEWRQVQGISPVLPKQI
jgi:hypothetical protein